jgi:hypothetical protein
VLLQKCDTNNFCKRNRGQKNSYSVDPKSLKVHGAELSAAITNTAAKQSFNFKLRAYGPVIRIMVDELPGDHVPRYQVPDILEPNLDQQLTPWQSPESTAKKWTGQVGDVIVHVTFSNFQIEVLVGKTPVAVFNSRSLFNMEHPRKKQVGVAGPAHQEKEQYLEAPAAEGKCSCCCSIFIASCIPGHMCSPLHRICSGLMDVTAAGGRPGGLVGGDFQWSHRQQALRAGGNQHRPHFPWLQAHLRNPREGNKLLTAANSRCAVPGWLQVQV